MWPLTWWTLRLTAPCRFLGRIRSLNTRSSLSLGAAERQKQKGDLLGWSTITLTFGQGWARWEVAFLLPEQLKALRLLGAQLEEVSIPRDRPRIHTGTSSHICLHPQSPTHSSLCSQLSHPFMPSLPDLHVLMVKGESKCLLFKS